MRDANNTKILDKLVYLKQKQFTGKVYLENPLKIAWTLYLCLGRLVWIEGGIHPNRSFKRLLNRYCPQLDLEKAEFTITDQVECEYYYLLMLLLQKNAIAQKETIEIVKTRAVEVLFDLLQQEHKQPLKLSSETIPASSLLASGLKMSITLVNLEEVLEEARQSWLSWQQKGLKNWSPNLAPLMREHDKMREEVSGMVFQNFLRLLDGERTLLELAYLMRKDIRKLTSSLAPYINQGLLNLIEIEDIDNLRYIKNTQKNNNFSVIKNTQPIDTQNGKNRPLIVCIDDSPQICKVMEHIIAKVGYRFIGVQEAIQAVPTLISVNPDLIFLDIGMPIVNGYEVCSQIRRVSKLKEIPVVILTGNDGIIDRVRAKVVGATSFIAKPIEVDKIIETINKFLPKQQSDQQESPSSENLDSNLSSSLI